MTISIFQKPLTFLTVVAKKAKLKIPRTNFPVGADMNLISMTNISSAVMGVGFVPTCLQDKRKQLILSVKYSGRHKMHLTRPSLTLETSQKKQTDGTLVCSHLRFDLEKAATK